ncbi:hypothetical protein [Cellulomonas hominis]
MDQAAEAYRTDAAATVTRLDTAHDQALPENSVWAKLTGSGAWQVLVTIATVVVVVAAVAAFVLTGPLALIVGVVAAVAGAILLVNDLAMFMNGDLAAWELALSAALTLIPGALLLKAAKRPVALVADLAMRGTPRLSGVAVRLGRVAARLGENGLNVVRWLTRPVNRAANAKLAWASDLQAQKIAMYDRLIERFEGNAWLTRVFDGSRFNWENFHRYTHHEVTLDVLDDAGRPTGQKFRLDSWTPGDKVVSRKVTQLADIRTDTALGYLDEAITKYKPGRDNLVVADTPANQAKFAGTDNILGQPLDGKLILEIPTQHQPIPQTILDHAADQRIEIVEVPRLGLE